MSFIRFFSDVTLTDLPAVGGKNASLGQMIADLSDKGIRIPAGFAITAEAYWHFLDHNNLRQPIAEALGKLTDHRDIAQLQQVAKGVRDLIKGGIMPDDLAAQIREAYKALCAQYDQEDCDVAVRSSATAEDLPTASFAGQQETFLNIRGADALIKACVGSMASLFTDRAIVYRVEQGFDHFKVALSVGVQKMVRADKASSGVAFSLDMETGFREVVTIESSWGLGETIVKGEVTPDLFVVHKPTMARGYQSIIRAVRGSKEVKAIYQDDPENPIAYVPTTQQERDSLSLSSDQVMELARGAQAIEAHYSKLKDRWMPMDVEWAIDGHDGLLYILQARPETIHANTAQETSFDQYRLQKTDAPLLVTGQSIGRQIASGVARVVKGTAEIASVKEGEVIVTDMTDPDWVPAMKRAAGIVTNRGGRTCHAAIVSRELGVPAIVGAQGATDVIATGAEVTLDCSSSERGAVYEGAVPFTVETHELKNIPESPVPLMLNCADPGSAFMHASLPVTGVGLARLEFIMSDIGVHPMALVNPDAVKDTKAREQIAQLSVGYDSPADWFVDRLSQGIGTITAAFYPRPVLVRLSDFKTNEYRRMIGGASFEPQEENPMLGFRGASRYTHELFRGAFALECAALVRAREVMGLKNMRIMVPFVRTVPEAQEVIALLERNGLVRGKDGLEIWMMCETPANVLLLEQFGALFDGFSIGSNDLTQLTLGIDRDSELIADLFDERDPAVKKILAMAIEEARRIEKPIGLCGQGPSDYPEIADFLIAQGIGSISLNPDSVLPFLARF